MERRDYDFERTLTTQLIRLWYPERFPSSASCPTNSHATRPETFGQCNHMAQAQGMSCPSSCPVVVDAVERHE
jgi:hypothetical protein